MPRFFFPEKVSGDTIIISDSEQLHHMRDVLRMKAADAVVVFDAEGSEYRCSIRSLDRKQGILEITSRQSARLKKVKIAIACAIPKKAKMDEIIDKLTQLDVDTIIPLDTERVVVKIEANLESRLERWKKIAWSAAEQSQRNTLPEITPVLRFEELLSLSRDYDLKLIPTLPGERKTLNQIFLAAQPSRVLAMIGPEGDFSEREVQRALDSGFVSLSLGTSVLRVDTAAIAVAAYLKFRLME